MIFDNLLDARLIRSELIQEAIRLARMLSKMISLEAAVSGLLALMLLHDSRSNARVDDSGDFIPLEKQNRNLWKKEQIEEGTSLLLSTNE